jgi:hypothetical protein
MSDAGEYDDYTGAAGGGGGGGSAGGEEGDEYDADGADAARSASASPAKRKAKAKPAKAKASKAKASKAKPAKRKVRVLEPDTDVSGYPSTVKAAIEVYAENIDEVKEMSKALSKKRKKTTEAANVIKEYMNEGEINLVRAGKNVFRRKEKSNFKCDPKRFEMSDTIPESVKNEFIRLNTIKEPSFTVK